MLKRYDGLKKLRINGIYIYIYQQGHRVIASQCTIPMCRVLTLHFITYVYYICIKFKSVCTKCARDIVSKGRIDDEIRAMRNFQKKKKQ
jgi:hypothetical protein